MCVKSYRYLFLMKLTLLVRESGRKGVAQALPRDEGRKPVLPYPGMRGRLVGRHAARRHLLYLRRRCRVGQWVVVEAPLHMAVRLAEVCIAVAVGAHPGMGLSSVEFFHATLGRCGCPLEGSS